MLDLVPEISPLNALPFSGLLILFFLLLLGAGVGFVGGLFGIGGGIIAIPILVLGMGKDQATAQGTALVMMLPNLLLAWWRYHRHHHHPSASPQSKSIGSVRLSLSVAIVATITTATTANLAQNLPQCGLLLFFTLFLLWIGLRSLLLRVTDQPEGISPTLPHHTIPAVGLLGGGCMGLLGIGGGLVATPALTRWYGLTQTQAQSVALALVTPSSAIALLTYADHGRVNWLIGGVLALGGVFFVPLGVSIAHRWSEQRLRKAFGAMLVLTAILLGFKAMGAMVIAPPNQP